MDLGTPESAIISAIIFNALIIPLLVPLALRGVRYRPVGATALLRRNLLIYGLGGLIAPFIGIKLIDLHRPQPARRRERDNRAAWRAPAAATTRSSSAWPRASARPTGCSRRAGPRPRPGRDVVIGYLEPHGRAETAAQAEGLERAPAPARCTTAARALEEMDLPAILARGARARA